MLASAWEEDVMVGVNGMSFRFVVCAIIQAINFGMDESQTFCPSSLSIFSRKSWHGKRFLTNDNCRLVWSTLYQLCTVKGNL